MYIGSNDRHLYALHGETGVQKWRFETNSEIWTAPAVSDDGVVFIASRYNGTMYAVSAKTGAQVWARPLAASIYSSPALFDGKVYFGADDSQVYALKQSDGTTAWSFTVGSRTAITGTHRRSSVRSAGAVVAIDNS